ncbi:hypothetical protein EAF00_001569 [Botryotinia globosa]|nr:hypothetical protein EAF00_001569 [Botryotinia globosa]
MSEAVLRASQLCLSAAFGDGLTPVTIIIETCLNLVFLIIAAIPPVSLKHHLRAYQLLRSLVPSEIRALLRLKPSPTSSHYAVHCPIFGKEAIIIAKDNIESTATRLTKQDKLRFGPFFPTHKLQKQMLIPSTCDWAELQSFPHPFFTNTETPQTMEMQTITY